MSFIYRDFLSPARMVYNMRMGLYRQFDRAFSKTTVDNIEVYNNRLYLYENGQITQNETTKRFLNKVGFEYAKLQEQDYTGIERLYLTFDSGKYNYTSVDKQTILNKLNLYFTPGDTFSVKITYGADLLKYFNDHDLILNDINYLINKLDSDPKKYYASTILLSDITKHYLASDPYTQQTNLRYPIISIVTENNEFESLALLDDGTYFNRTGISKVTYKTKTTAVEGKIIDEISFIYNYEVLSVPTVEDCQIVNYLKDISDIIEYSSKKVGTTHILIGDYYSYLNNSIIKKVISSWQDYDTTIFYKNYLRVAEVTNMNKGEFMKVVGKTLTVGYDEEDVPWYKKVLSVIVIIAAVVVAYITMNPAALGSATGWVLAGKIATGLFWVSTTLSIGLLAVVYVGGKANTGGWTRFIAGAAQVTGYGAAILGAMTALRNVVQSYISETAQFGMKQVISGLNSVTNLYNVYSNITAQDVDNNVTETQDPALITAGDIDNYRQIMMENDALTQTDVTVERSLGGNTVEIIMNNQTN